MNANHRLTASQIDKIKRAAEQARCLPGMLLGTPFASDDLVIGMLIACQNFAEDIDAAIGSILREAAQ